MTEGTNITVSAATAYALIDQTAPFLPGKNEVRNQIRQIAIRAGEREIVATAADGYALAEVTAPYDGDAVEVSIPWDAAKTVTRTLKKHAKDPRARAVLTGCSLTILDGDGEIVTVEKYEPHDAHGGPFPESYHELIPPRRDVDFSRYAMAGRYMAAVGELAARHSHQTGAARVQPGPHDKSPIRFDWESRDGDIRTVIVVMPVFLEWPKV